MVVEEWRRAEKEARDYIGDEKEMDRSMIHGICETMSGQSLASP
jgi:hypothetical protein